MIFSPFLHLHWCFLALLIEWVFICIMTALIFHCSDLLMHSQECSEAQNVRTTWIESPLRKLRTSRRVKSSEDDCSSCSSHNSSVAVVLWDDFLLGLTYEYVKARRSALSSLLAAPSHPSIPYLHKIKQKQSTHDVLGWQWDRNKNKIKTSTPKRSQRDRKERKFTIIGWKCCVVRAQRESATRTHNTRSTNSATSRQTRDFVAHVDESTSEQRREVERKEENWLSRIRTRSSYAFNTGTMLYFTSYILHIYNPFFHSLVLLSFITLHNFNVVQFKWE